MMIIGVNKKKSLNTQFYNGGDNMDTEMMRDREPIVDEAVDLMITKERYGLDFSVSDAIYNRLQDDTNNGGLN